MDTTHVLVVGVGGLGQAMMREALERGLRTSVLVRDRAKFEATVDETVRSALERVTEGGGTDPDALDRSTQDVDAVLSGLGADPQVASALAEAVQRNGVGKLCWPAGATNVKAEDGITPNYESLRDLGDWVEGAYRAHQACIDAIDKAAVTSVILCPGRMAAVGRRSNDVASTVRIDRDAGRFLSYEDAAWVMVEGALTTAWDDQLVSAATPQ